MQVEFATHADPIVKRSKYFMRVLICIGILIVAVVAITL